VAQTPTTRLLGRLRAMMTSGAARLPQVLELVAGELVAEVCSAYGLRSGEILELRATHGLRESAIGRTRLRVGEGIVGLVAATGEALNLADAQNHPGFAYRPETGEEPYASMLAVPVRRGGRILGVLTVQNRATRRYSEEEVELMETVALLVTDMLAAPEDGAAEKGFSGTVPRHFAAVALSPGIVLGRVVLHGSYKAPGRLLAEDPAAEAAREAWRDAYIRRLFRVITEDVEALSRETDPS